MKTVLLVDIDSGSFDSAEVLQRNGFHRIVASNAHDALSIIRTDRTIDLIVTEMQFSDMDGLHFLTAVRAIAPLLPIIVVTASSSIESYLLAVNFGVHEYLSKPVLPAELARIASNALAAPRTAPRMRDAS